MRWFKSDNVAAACPEVLAAMNAANLGPAEPYGNDELTRRLDEVFSRMFATRVRVFPVLSGTAANALALATLCPPWGAILAHAEAHIERDECGAPEFFSGARLALLQGAAAKIDAATLRDKLQWYDGTVHSVLPRVLSITQATERGSVYQPGELRALAAVAHANNMAVYMDGARFANAVVALGCEPADITWRVGVDALAFGAIKNGGMNAEAVVFFENAAHGKERFIEFEYRRKRAGHLACKGRFFAAQLLGLVESDAWRRNADHANRLARRIGAALASRLTVPVETNQVFAQLGTSAIESLTQQGFAFYSWGPSGSGEARFVVSWNTSEADVEALCEALAKV